MRVRELIEELGKHDPDSPVLMDEPASDFRTRREVGSVSAIHAVPGTRDIEWSVERQPPPQAQRAVLISWSRPITHMASAASA